MVDPKLESLRADLNNAWDKLAQLPDLRWEVQDTAAQIPALCQDVKDSTWGLVTSIRELDNTVQEILARGPRTLVQDSSCRPMTGQGTNAANFLSDKGPQYKKEAAIAHWVRGLHPSHNSIPLDDSSVPIGPPNEPTPPQMNQFQAAMGFSPSFQASSFRAGNCFPHGDQHTWDAPDTTP